MGDVAPRAAWLPRPKRQPKTFWFLLCWAVLQGAGALWFLVKGELAAAALQAVIMLLVASVPVRLARG
jgi:hypothetical protein